MAFRNFNYQLAYDSQGVDPSMYSDDPKEAQRMMNEDMQARWQKDPAAFQREMLTHQAKSKQQQARATPAAPRMAAPQQQGFTMHPIAQQQAQAAAGMVGQLHSAFAKENDRRVEQARDEQERAHELQVKQMEAQQRQAQLNQEKAMADEAQRRKDQRNAMLMSMAGVPMGHQIRTDGRGGVNIFRNALLG